MEANHGLLYGKVIGQILTRLPSYRKVHVCRLCPQRTEHKIWWWRGISSDWTLLRTVYESKSLSKLPRFHAVWHNLAQTHAKASPTQSSTVVILGWRAMKLPIFQQKLNIVYQIWALCVTKHTEDNSPHVGHVWYSSFYIFCRMSLIKDSLS